MEPTSTRMLDATRESWIRETALSLIMSGRVPASEVSRAVSTATQLYDAVGDNALVIGRATASSISINMPKRTK